VGNFAHRGENSRGLFSSSGIKPERAGRIVFALRGGPVARICHSNGLPLLLFLKYGQEMELTHDKHAETYKNGRLSSSQWPPAAPLPVKWAGNAINT
jgi:hypothetical protein